MPEPLNIPFTVPGIRTAAKDAAELAANFQRAGNEAQKFASGPFQRLASLQTQQARAGGAGGAVRQDLAYLITQAQRRVDRIQGAGQAPSRADKIMRAVLSSRFSVGGKGGGGGGGSVMPLVGQTLEALGIGGALSAVGGAALAAAGLIKTLGEAAVEAAASVNQFSNLRATSGASSAEAGRLRTLGNVAGVGDIAGLSRSLHERITSDPFAMAQAQGMGVNAVGGPFGTLDTARETLQIVRGLRALKGEDRLYAARQMGAEQLLPLTRVSDKTMTSLDKDAFIQSRINNPEQERRAAELTTAAKRAQDANEAVKTAFGNLFPGTTSLLNTYADVLFGLADKLTDFNGWLDKVAGNNGKGSIGNSLKSIGGAGGDSSGASTDGRGNAIDMNTQAIGQNTTALRQLHGKIGGGEYAAGALPSALGGMNLRRAYDMHALNLSTL